MKTARSLFFAATIAALAFFCILFVLIGRRSSATTNSDDLRADPFRHSGTSSSQPASSGTWKKRGAVQPSSSLGDKEMMITKRDPVAAVKEAVLAPYSAVEEERAKVIASLEQSGSCRASWCDEAREALRRWISSAEDKLTGVKASAIECSGGGCWTQVTLTPANRFAELVNVPHTEAGWRGMSLQGAPDLSAVPGSAVLLWVLIAP